MHPVLQALQASKDTLDPKVCLAIKEKKEKLAGTDPAAPRENGEKWACLASLELTEYRAFRDLRDLEEHLALMVAMVQREILGRSVLLDHTGRPVTLAHLVHQDREESPPMDPLEQKERRVTPDAMVKLDLPDLQELMAFLDKRVTLALKDHRVSEEMTDQ